MLSDVALDNLMQPIIDRQEEIDRFVLELIAARLKSIGELSTSDIYRIRRLLQMGADMRLLTEELARLADLQVRDIHLMLESVAKDFYLDARHMYEYRNQTYIPYEENQKLHQLVEAIGNVTSETYVNLSNSTSVGFLVEDQQHPGQLVFKSIENTYRDAVDKAIQAVTSKSMDYNMALRRTVNQLVESGVRKIYYPSGYSQRLDSALRRDLTTGIQQINIQMNLIIGEETGADGVELSAHMDSAPDHEPFQGHQFTLAEFEKLQGSADFQDVEGERFAGVERVIGMWNCRHLTYMIIVGVTKPRFTKEQLTSFIEHNNQGYTTSSGKHMTMYECTQYQRQLETKIREAKDGQILYRKLGDLDTARRCQGKINKYMEQYRQFSKDAGLRQKIDRTRVNGYHRIKA